MSSRHPNCTPMRVIGDRRPAVSMSQQSRREARAELERDVADFLASGGKITKLHSGQASTVRTPAFNDMPGEYAA